MPVADRQSARDSILTLFHATWDAQAPPVPPVVHDDRKADTPADATSWAEVIIRHFDGRQRTLGQVGNRRFESVGVVVTRVYTKYGDGLATSDLLVQTVIDAFEGKRTTDGVVFRNVRPSEFGQDGTWYRVDVLADMEYDRIK